ncbi:MAG TPA: SDR family oxidoreductase [Candidatus Krumholzibacteria bacterium]|nr:SDR family oxidoreductase [Candidatus Krumholzibacteria bacterium]
MFTLHGRKALITGGGSGIGAATARQFSRAGASVYLVGRGEDNLRGVQEEISSAGGKAGLLAADLYEAEAAERVVASAARSMDGIDILVNNAGLYFPQPVTELELDQWQAHFDLNVRAPYLLCKAAYSWLKAAEEAVVVNVLSNLAHRPVRGAAAYCASKAALLSFGQSLALEWAADGIRVVSVSPGVVQTPIHQGADLRGAAKMHPLGRIGTAEEVASAILFLASEESAWTTGSDFSVDGGLHLV